MTREEAIKEIEKVFEPAFANYIVEALTKGATVSDCISKKQELNPIAIVKIKYDEDKLKELVDKAVFTTAMPSEWERDHEILKAYSNGANEVLDKIRAEIEELKNEIRKEHNYGADAVYGGHVIDGINAVLQIFDKYKAESEGKE